MLFLQLFRLLLLFNPVSAFSNTDYFVYSVVSGDVLWKIGVKYSVSVSDIQSFNGMGTSTALYIGQKLKIPVYDLTKVVPLVEIIHTIAYGDILWKLSQHYGVSISSICTASNITTSTVLYTGKQLKIPIPVKSTVPAPAPIPIDTKPYITYVNYTAIVGDTIWSVSQKFGIPEEELMSANNFTASSYLKIGQVTKVPVHHVPVTQTPGDKYGEYLDWWTQAQYVWPIGKDAVMVDFYTGKSWNVRRTIGYSHSDTETLTAQDTATMKSVWGGTWNWNYRPVLIIVDGRKIAASAAGMPHAGLDAYPAYQTVDNRSGDYGTGPNYDYIKGNEMDGHFDVHFLNSKTHNTGEVVPQHQANIKIAAGIN